MRSAGFRHHGLGIVSQLTVAGVLMLVLATWPSGCWREGLQPDGTYHYGQATIVVDSFEAITSYESGGPPPYAPVFHYYARNGYFPTLNVSVASREGCSLALEPKLYCAFGRIVSLTTRPPLEQVVEVAAGESKTLHWRFPNIGWDDAPEKLVIKVSDLDGGAEPGEAVFLLGEPTRPTPMPQPTTTGVATETTARGPIDLEFENDDNSRHESVRVGDHITIRLDLSALDLADVEWESTGGSGILSEQPIESHKDGPYLDLAVKDYKVIGAGETYITVTGSSAPVGRFVVWCITLTATE